MRKSILLYTFFQNFEPFLAEMRKKVRTVTKKVTINAGKIFVLDYVDVVIKNSSF
jgi:hypothetical protein